MIIGTEVKACQCFLPSLCWAMVLLGVFMTMGALIMGTSAKGAYHGFKMVYVYYIRYTCTRT